MEAARAAEGRIPLGDVAVRRLRIDPADAIAVQLRIPDHPIDRRVIEAVGRDAAGFTLAARLDLAGFEEVILFSLERLRVQSEYRVPPGIGIPDVTLGILGVDAQGVRP